MVHKVLFEHYLLVGGQRHELKNCRLTEEGSKLTFIGEIEFCDGLRDIVTIVSTTFRDFRSQYPDVGGCGTLIVKHALYYEDDSADWWKGEDGQAA